MKLDLKQNWGITATTLYDRPRPHTNSNFNPDNFLAKYSQSPLKNN